MSDKVKAALAAMRARCEAAQKVRPKLLAHQSAIADLPKLLAVAEAAAEFIEQRDRYNSETEETEYASLSLEAEKLCCLREALAALGEP